MSNTYTLGSGSCDLGQVGGKGYGLDRLYKLGYCRVPSGFVVTVDAFERAPLHEVLRDVGVALDGLQGDLFAVRSSGVAEDLPGHSFAGQYESFLNVPRSGVFGAIVDCYQSASAPRVQAYMAARGLEPKGMAVVVQEMVNAVAAGTVFTANPVTGDRGQVLVSAVAGLGDALVSGQVVPDEWVVQGNGDVIGDSDSLDSYTVRGLAYIARWIAHDLGNGPLDLEWALEKGSLPRWLQARPITALPLA